MMLKHGISATATTAMLAMTLLAGSLAMPTSTRAQEATPAICAEMTDEGSRRLAEEFMAMVAARDLSGIGEIVAPDITYDSPISGLKTGPDGVAAAIGAIFASYPDVDHVARDIIADTDMAVIRWTATGTNTGPLRGIEPTGEQRDWTGVYVLQTACGKIARAAAEVDQLAVLGMPGGNMRSVEADAPDAAATPGACESTSEDALRAAVDTLWNDAWNAHDASAYRRLVTPDVIQHWTSGDDTEGVEASVARLESFFTAMPDVRITWNDISAEGDLAAATWILTGTDTGGMFGAPPTGASIEYDGVNIFRFACGSIAEIWSEGDILRMQKQLAGR